MDFSQVLYDAVASCARRFKNKDATLYMAVAVTLLEQKVQWARGGGMAASGPSCGAASCWIGAVGWWIGAVGCWFGSVSWWIGAMGWWWIGAMGWWIT